MSAETDRAASVLSAEELDSFWRHGFLYMKEAFPRELALALQDEVWSEIEEEHGIVRSDPGTWTTPAHSPRRAKHAPLNEGIANERFLGAISDLLGYDTWQRPSNWGGFLISFPTEPGTPRDVPSDTWHWDGSPTSTGLLIFSFYAEVRPGGGGTHILSGSPRLIEDFYASLSPDDLARAHKVHRKMLARWDPWLEALTGRSKEPVEDRVATFMERTTEVRGVPCRVVELTGEPGDVVFCNLGMMHATAPNRLDVPRFMRVKFLFIEK